MPSQNLKIALIPLDIQFGDSEYNLKQFQSKLTNLEKDTDLVVLPEMFNTGFTPERQTSLDNAEPDNGRIISMLRNIAVSKHLAIWGGISAKDNIGNLYNRGFMIDDVGNIKYYDKRHLFRYGGESDIYTAGSTLSPIVNYRSWNIKMSICYDIRFPVWNRTVKNNYDVLIVPANWAHSRVYAWRQLLIARAIENQCYVAGCNREGSDNYGKYQEGDSWIFNESGMEISYTGEDNIIYGILDAAKFNSTRNRFTPWRDADSFNLILD
ncbi:MAG: nitrilase family protein [Paramuribaculum sp.]|nr:nitrilase family protein [Paramuribaculum sp.]